MTFKVVLEPSEEGGYTVYVPALPGCSSCDLLSQALGGYARTEWQRAAASVVEGVA
jgi:hypothetical protein